MRPGKKHVSVTGCKSCHIANVLANQKRLNQCAEQKERVPPEAHVLFSEKSLLQQVLGLRPRTA